SSFKERILEVFRYQSNASKKGLKNDIGRELDMIKRTSKEELQEVDSETFYIQKTTDNKVDINTLMIDHEEDDEDQYVELTNGDIYIHPLDQEEKHVVSFIYGIEMHELHDSKDEELNTLMYKDNGEATPRLLKWVEYINMIAPLFWNHFTWDEGFWDTVSKEMTGLGYVPNRWDSPTDIWENYTMQYNRWDGDKVWQ